MLIIPIGDINPRTRFPWVNYTILALNIGIFFMLYFGPDYNKIIQQFGLIPLDHRPLIFITSQVGGVVYWAHIGGFVFGLIIVGLLRLMSVVRGSSR